MILFLQRDTSKPHPAGFEGLRRNIFDPEEDVIVAQPQKKTAKNVSKQAQVAVVSPIGSGVAATKTGVSIVEDKPTPMDIDAVSHNGTKRTSNGHLLKKKERKSTCARDSCQQRPRFDSIFCSDSCGVSALEFDLLCSLQYTSEVHTSALRL